jgi:dCTP deaminase
MILSGNTIRRYCAYGEPIIDPFNERTKHEGMTYGVGPAGYDVRVEFDEEGKAKEWFLGPGEFMLASTIERFKMPTDVLGIVHDKSSWARLGLTVQNTVIEPGWQGWLTLELANHGDKHLRISRGVAIAQVVFHRIDEHVEAPYKGKYQNQKRGPVPAIIDN